jgi:uncharacterized protein YeaO (DUF488 family)
MTGARFRLVRIYEPNEGRSARARLLVDRPWPRGVSEVAAHLDEWLKDIAPSAELRTWYGHDVDRFEEFARRHRADLRGGPGSHGSTTWSGSSPRDPST